MQAFKIGDIVTLHSHPFFEKFTDAIISGDGLSIPPLMVVSEVINSYKDEFDEKTANQISFKGVGNFKCIYYSNKTQKYEEEWISGKQLKLIKSLKSEQRDVKALQNRQALFSTIDLEESKRKSTFSSEQSDTATRNTTKVNSLLSYVSPVMIVSEVKKNDKLNTYDIKTGNSKHQYPEVLVKCKWFNSISDKYSEQYLPLESIMLLVEVSEEYLDKCNMFIKKGEYLTNSEENELIQIKQLIYKSGRYYTKYVDKITYKIHQVANFDLSKYKPIGKPYIDTFPNNIAFATDYKKALISFIKKSIREKYMLRIKYVDINSEMTTRVVSSYSFIKNEKGEYSHLHGFCNLRGSERTFNLDRIQSITQLKIKYLGT